MPIEEGIASTGTGADLRSGAPFIDIKATRQGQLETKTRDVETILADILTELQAISYGIALQLNIGRDELDESVDNNTAARRT
ncbi:MAG TPA: hypothetical protein VG099_24655 [Gemmataceae bacterium]|jgi:hypothetical protein|nr:hypothetical protein [Gemmataceae bacterium]